MDQGPARRKVCRFRRLLGADAWDGRPRAGPPAARDGEPARRHVGVHPGSGMYVVVYAGIVLVRATVVSSSQEGGGRDRVW